MPTVAVATVPVGVTVVVAVRLGVGQRVGVGQGVGVISSGGVVLLDEVTVTIGGRIVTFALLSRCWQYGQIPGVPSKGAGVEVQPGHGEQR